jgi:hypothetical protein
MNKKLITGSLISKGYLGRMPPITERKNRGDTINFYDSLPGRGDLFREIVCGGSGD